ncbi:GPI inositol-deacylase [Anaeromyxobacter oryzae]|uniref:Permease n=1 Tax=Anaeromyxobacter oryzae TaxID=2918170 RepID=A0ABM7WPK5_9BACT|nr:GPI inositol-deacylase [Anaeromyxobacter oryzae]BDG01395.1 permease [Anaeromyxobacter oryzae]
MTAPRTIDVVGLCGWGRLAVDATLGLARVVEAMHAEIAHPPFLPGRRPGGRTRGITGLVYRSIRGGTRLAGLACEAGLALADRWPAEGNPTPRAEAVVAALNGIVGDHLAATGNPLAIPMQLRRDGRPLVLERRVLTGAIPGASRRVVVLVHGFCMDDRSWARGGHDHGAALARDLGCTPVYVRYNSGLHVSTNGRSLAALLEELVRAWPVPVEALAIVGHSMGGLVARSACHQAAAGLAWLRRLGALVFLGTPHHGAPLEVGGQWLHAILGVSRYTAPLALLGRIRSAGVTDLRHASLLDEDWQGRDRFALGRRPAAVPLPPGVSCLAIAGRMRRAGAVLGDGLVTVDGALGRHRDPRRALALDEAQRWVAQGVGHLDLLGDAGVYARLRAALAPGARGSSGSGAARRPRTHPARCAPTSSRRRSGPT